MLFYSAGCRYGRGAIDGSKCFALQRCRAAARHTASLRVSDASLRVSDASLRVSDASLRVSDASLRVSDASLRVSDASLRLCHFILTFLEPFGSTSRAWPVTLGPGIKS
ncbi:MAG: hypothetical protein ACJ8CR_07795 [Roseiflexaceae bacterium]